MIAFARDAIHRPCLFEESARNPHRHREGAKGAAAAVRQRPLLPSAVSQNGERQRRSSFQPWVAPNIFGATLGQRPKRFFNPGRVEPSTPKPGRCNPFRNLCKRCSVEALPRHRFHATPHFRPQAGHYTLRRADFAEVSIRVAGHSRFATQRSSLPRATPGLPDGTPLAFIPVTKRYPASPNRRPILPPPPAVSRVEEHLNQAVS